MKTPNFLVRTLEMNISKWKKYGWKCRSVNVLINFSEFIVRVFCDTFVNITRFPSKRFVVLKTLFLNC